jgi:hypothetical protein
MIEIQRQKCQAMKNAYFFIFFNILKLKMHGLKNKLIYNPIVYKKYITQAGHQATKHPAQSARKIKMKK